MRRALILGLSVVGLLVLASCENTFSPKGPYTEELVVYSILSTRSDAQYVRVYATYNPSGFNPLEQTTDTFVRNAQITITSGPDVYHLRDTTIKRVDQSRYTDDLAAYIGFPMPVRPGETYSLSVSTDRGTVEATATVPGNGSVTAHNPYVFKDPERYGEDISATIYLSPIAFGYLVRIYINFEYFAGGTWKPGRAEVPISTAALPNGEDQLNYPRLTRRAQAPSGPAQTIYFPIGAYEIFLTQLQNQYGGAGTMHILSATFILTQVEPNLYKYFNIVNGFQDEFSIRTDLPDFTNIQGGVGVFGAMTEDSVVADLTQFQ